MLKRSLFAVAAAAFLFACAGQKVPAQAAITAAETAFSAVKAEAMQYVPDQAKGVQDALDAANAAFQKGDYAAALAAAKDVATKSQELASAAAAKKAELTKTWEGLSAGLPKMVDAIKSRVDILSQAKKLPANLDKAKLEDAKSGLAAITQTWQAASDAAKSGNVADALAKASTVKAKAVEIMGLLGMQVPAAAQ